MEMVRQQLLLKVLNKYEENILKGEFVFPPGDVWEKYFRAKICTLKSRPIILGKGIGFVFPFCSRIADNFCLFGHTFADSSSRHYILHLYLIPSARCCIHLTENILTAWLMFWRCSLHKLSSSNVNRIFVQSYLVFNNVLRMLAQNVIYTSLIECFSSTL